MTAVPLPRDLSEAAWMRTVIDTAKRTGWMVQHVRPAMRQSGKWSTPVQGDIGAPDLWLARGGDVLGAELKTNRGQLRPEQRVWLDHLGDHGRVWRPADLDAVLARLTRRGAA